MMLSHGGCCERLPWLGQPNIDTASTTWVDVQSTSQLNELLNDAYGTARLVESELDARTEGVTMQWLHYVKSEAGVSTLQCQLKVTKSTGDGYWSIQMAGPTRALAKLRAQMALLHCYQVLLKASSSGVPVDYEAVWQEAAQDLASKFAPLDLPREPPSLPAQPAILAAPRVAVVAATVAPVAEPVGSVTSEHFGSSVEATQAYSVGASSVDMWGPAADTYGNAWPVPRATRAMSAVARYHTNVYACPVTQGWPETKMVPVTALRVALGLHMRSGRRRIHDCTDDQLLDSFVAESRVDDTAAHGGVPRFGRTVLNASTMRPVNEASRPLLTPGELCLVVRKKRQD